MQTIKLYRNQNGYVVTNVEHKKIRHSPTGFEWGYSGSGPSELALNILLMFVDEKTTDELYQYFKRDFITSMPYEGGTISYTEIKEWIYKKLKEESINKEKLKKCLK